MSRIAYRLGLAWVLLLLVGCSGQASTNADNVPSGELATATVAVPATTTVAAPQFEVLAGMYGWDPHDGFHDTQWSGTLVVHPPCVYLDNITFTPEPAAPPTAPVRSYLRLPEPLTRYDAATGEIWVAGNGPMSHGDNVTVFGSQGWRLKWNRNDDHQRHTFEDTLNTFSVDRPGCSARLSFWAASMSPADAQDPYTPNISQLPGLEFFDWEPDQEWPAVGANGGTLVIEPPCVYFDLTVGVADVAADWRGSTRLDEPVRYRLRLVKPFVRYHPDDITLSYRDKGPFTSGDEVYGLGGGGSPGRQYDILDQDCPAAGTYTTTYLGPRRELP